MNDFINHASGNGSKVIDVALVEDHRVLVEALKLFMAGDVELSFVGSASTVSSGRELIKQVHPDVLLLDIGLPDGDGLTLIDDVKQFSPVTQVVVLTSYADEQNLIRAIDCGATGFIPKSSSLTQLITAIHQAARGETVIPNSLLVGLLAKLPGGKNAHLQGKYTDVEHITPREKEVLECLALGESVEVIAAELVIAPLTVRTHIRNIMTKLGAHSRLEAVAMGLRHGIIEPPTYNRP